MKNISIWYSFPIPPRKSPFPWDQISSHYRSIQQKSDQSILIYKYVINPFSGPQIPKIIAQNLDQVPSQRRSDGQASAQQLDRNFPLTQIRFQLANPFLLHPFPDVTE